MTYVSDSGLSCGNDGCVFSEVASLSWKLFSLVVSHSFSPWKLFIFFNHFLSYSHTFFCIGAIPVSCSRSHAALSISKDAGFQFPMIWGQDTGLFLFLFLFFSMLILIIFFLFLFSMLIINFFFSFLFFHGVAYIATRTATARQALWLLDTVLVASNLEATLADSSNSIQCGC